MMRLTPSRLILAGVMSLGAAILVGGGVLSLVEDGSFLDGVWLAFTVVSTTGFGEGPATRGGQLLAMCLFVWAAVSYLLLIVAASAHGQLIADEKRRLRAVSKRDLQQVARELHRN